MNLADLTIGEVLGYLFGPFGTLMICLIIIVTGYKRYWVFGWYAQELKDRNKRLEDRIDKIAGQAKSITSVAEQTASLAEKKAEANNE